LHERRLNLTKGVIYVGGLWGLWAQGFMIPIFTGKLWNNITGARLNCTKFGQSIIGNIILKWHHWI